MNHSSPSSVLFNTIAQIAGKALTLFFGLATTAIIYRTLGTSEYGVYVFVTSFVLLFATISDWGTEIITVREASRSPHDQRKIFGTALLIKLLLSFGTVLLTNLVIRLFPGWRPFVIPVTLFSLVLIALAVKISAGGVFLTRRTLVLGAATEVVNNGIYLLGILALLSGSPHLLTALNLLIFSTFLAALVAWFWATRVASISVELHPEFGKTILKEALPTGALLTIFYIYNRVDIVILQAVKGNQAVGYYGLAYKIHDNLTQGAAFLMNAVFPLIAANPPVVKLKNLYTRAFDVLFAGASFIFIFFFIFAPWIINLVGGPAASPAVAPLRILIFATAIAYINHLTGYTLIAIGHQRTSLAIAIAALFINVIGNILLIPRFSFIAAAFMTIVTEGTVFLLSSLAIFRYTNIVPSLKNIFSTVSLALKTRGHIFEEDE